MCGHCGKLNFPKFPCCFKFISITIWLKYLFTPFRIIFLIKDNSKRKTNEILLKNTAKQITINDNEGKNENGIRS